MMEERTMKNNVMFIGLIVIVCVAVAMLLLGIRVAMNYEKKVNEKTVCVTGNDWFCPFGTEIEEQSVLNIRGAQEIYHQSFSSLDFMTQFGIATRPELALVKSILKCRRDIERREEITSETKIEIPAGARAIDDDFRSGKHETASSIWSGTDYSSEIVRFLDSSTNVCAWDKDYRLNSGEEVSETHCVIIIDNDVFWGTLREDKNKTRYTLDIFHAFLDI